MLKGSYRKNILLLSFVILLMFPLYNIFVIYPSFHRLIVNKTENEAVRLASYLATKIIVGEDVIDKEHLPATLSADVNKIQKDFELIKLKIFMPDGEIAYSTTPEEVGQVNEKSYFHNIVATGDVYTKIVHKQTKSLEDQVVVADVVETYVPVMRGDNFLGAFEIYYDITKSKAEMDRLTTHITVMLFIVSSGLLLAIVLFFFKTSEHVADSIKIGQQKKRAYQFTILLSAAVFFAELMIMLALDFFTPQVTAFVESLIDSFFLVCILFPVLYLLTFRPMMLQITNLEQKERSLRKSEREWYNTFNSISDFVSVHDKDFKILRANRSLADFLGATMEDITGKHCYEVFHNTSVHLHNCPHFDTLKSRETIVREVDDTESGLYMLVTTSPVHDDSGELIGSVHVARDISELKKKEEELRLFRFLIDNSNDAILIIDPTTGVFLDVNEKTYDSFGYTREQLSSMRFTDIEADDSEGAEWETLVARVRDREHMLFERKYKRNDGSLFDVEVNIKYISYIKSDYMIAVVRDITEKKQSEMNLKRKSEELEEMNRNLENMVAKETRKRLDQERLLIQQSKIASMGEMIGAIAHQWRQPLNALSIMVQEIQDAYEFGDLDEKYIDETVKNAMSQVQYMSKTIDDFRNFYRHSTDKETFSVIKAVKSAVSLQEAQLKQSQINVIINTDIIGSYRVYGYANEFKQVLLNIISNARGAIIEAREEGLIDKENGEISIDLTQLENQITISITNNGKIIPEGIFDRIFEPYFTTKKGVEGTGIGLYMSKTIIEKHMGGKIYAANVEEGVTFTIELAANESP